MYTISNKEKMKLLRELHNPAYAEADMNLLRQVNPFDDLFKTPIVNVSRASEKILYALLGLVAPHIIRLNRRAFDTPDLFGQTSDDAGEYLSDVGQTKSESDEAKGELEQTADELNEVKDELEQAQHELEQVQYELDEVKDELEEEKKNEAVPKS